MNLLQLSSSPNQPLPIDRRPRPALFSTDHAGLPESAPAFRIVEETRDGSVRPLRGNPVPGTVPALCGLPVTDQPTPPLLALNPTSRAAVRIKTVLRMGDSARVIGPMVRASGWRELAELGEGHPGAPAIVGTTEGANEPSAVDPRQAGRRDWSHTPLIHYGPPRSAEQPTTPPKFPFAAEVSWGVDDEITTLDAAILRSIDVQRENRLLEHVRHEAHPFAHRLLRHALHRSLGASTVLETANALAHPQRTVYRRCDRLGIPNPGALLSLARIFTVERLAEWSRQPTGGVALALGFSHPANYRRLARRRVGVPPSVIRERGGADYMEEVIVRALAGR